MQKLEKILVDSSDDGNLDFFGGIKEGVNTIVNTVLNTKIKLVDKLNILLETIPSYSWYILEKILYLRNTNRKEGLITKENIEEYLKIAKPGDILLSRADGYYFSTLIKGFWKHMAVYVGTGEYLKKNLSDEQIKNLGIDDNKHYIIESTTSNGVQLEELEKFLSRNDYLGVFEYNLSDEEKSEVIKNGFLHVKKKYDFKFDATDDSKIFCSELFLHIFKDFHKKQPKIKNIGPLKLFLPIDFVEYVQKNPDLINPKFFIDNDNNGNHIKQPEELFKTLEYKKYRI